MDVHAAARVRAGDRTCLAASDGCGEGNCAIDLLMLVLNTDSAVGAARRETLRAQLAPSAAPLCAVRWLFVLGANESMRATWHSPPRFQAPDMLLTHTPERYELISLKVLTALQWSVGHTRSQYLMKSDDDSFVCGESHGIQTP